MSDDIAYLTATELVENYRARKLSPVEATRAVLARVDALNPVFNAFCVLDPDRALADARQSEQRWQRNEPLGAVDGVPTTVKDLILAKGWPTRRGSKTVDPAQAWEEDGAPVARLRERGAVLLGKTATPEFGWKGVTDSALTGITRNPWDQRLTPGGSSGGAAVCAALGMGPLHVATDGGGSIRIPAAFCGVFGFKPTWGVVPVHPHSPAWTLWHQGPLVRTVEDAALMLSVISKPDSRDWYAPPSQDIDYRKQIDGGIEGWRIAYSRTLGYANMDREVAALVEKALEKFADLGASIEIVDLKLPDPIDIMQPLWAVALALAVAPMTPQQRALVEPGLLAVAEPAFKMSAIEYRQVEKAREAFGRRMNGLHAQYDLLVTPQMPITAFEAGHEVPPEGSRRRWWEWSPFTYPFNLTQQPAASVPCGFDSKGLPVAMQLIGAKFADARVLRAARAFESAMPFRMPREAERQLLPPSARERQIQE
ncbi:MAG TPA: amidase, partial [Burkholderiales bacterium]|nr:amidase [Burkholderiales bacterium]